MKYDKTLKLKNGMSCRLRSGLESDGETVLDNFKLTHSETDYLGTYPDENTLDAEQEIRFLKEKYENERLRDRKSVV